MSKPVYLKLLEAMHAQGKLPQMGEVTVRHDSWCAIWQGKPCNCHPSLKVQSLPNRAARRAKNR